LPRFRQFYSLFLLALTAVSLPSSAQWNPANPVRSLRNDPSGLTIFLLKGALRFEILSESVIRVRYSPNREFPNAADDVLIKSDWPATPFEVQEKADLGGGRAIATPAPLEEIPLFVRAGTILPLGAAIEFAQQSCDAVELRVYPGADKEFTLYADQGDTYNYEKGAYATIALRWNDSLHLLTIAKREGSYPGMAQELRFNIVFVHKDHRTEIAETRVTDSTVTYDGRAVEIKWNPGAGPTSRVGFAAATQYARQSQAMRSNLSTNNSGGPRE
jgi:Domain of unknown function (DUF5110)/Domain of unknown function (DUF4968)